MAISSGLTAALKQLVLDLEDDLRDRVEAQPEVRARWVREHYAAVGRERTAMSWQEWRDDRVTQAAVAWVLTTVFVRFAEDNRLLGPVWLAGPPDRQQEALDGELDYFRRHPEHTDREWLLHAVEHLRGTSATRDLVESHSPLWSVSPSGQAAKQLIAFWRERTADGGLRWDLADDQLSTRFLGDLYQDLSDYAQKTFALKQTPEFVEEFILDRTLGPALRDRPLEGFRLIDPTCGSGHFLLGAFHRLNAEWVRRAPGLNPRARVNEVLKAICGVDLNPFAVAIARFRLTIAALQDAGETSLETPVDWTLHLAVGDSLLHGATQTSIDDLGHSSGVTGFAYSTEDRQRLDAILGEQRYDVVVGNPPYITVKDKSLNAAYRDLYTVCHRAYALSVPFMQRFFELAKPAIGDRPAGWVGQITSNSFMKREFGSKLIEEFLRHQDLQLVADTSGAFIPGHGTPTVILVGRPQAPVGTTVRAVLGVRSEPGEPAIPAEGLAWRSIVDHVDDATYDGEYVTVTDLPRTALNSHPWSMGGGAAPDLLQSLERQSSRHLSDVADSGFRAITGADEVFVAPEHVFRRLMPRSDHRSYVTGEGVRDWAASGQRVLFPYVNGRAHLGGAEHVRLWPFRTDLRERRRFGTPMARLANVEWFELREFYPKRFATKLVLAFSFVATHNHFALDRGGKVFNRAAPIVQLPEGADENDHLALQGVLNSSTACFWLKQNSHDKGSQGINEGVKAESWERFFEFTGTTLKDFPLPAELPLDLARSLDAAAGDAATRFEQVLMSETPPRDEDLARLRQELFEIRAQMVAYQEELDWQVYRDYGLIDFDLAYSGQLPEVALGERAFEIVLARKVAAGGASTAWFARHGSTPVTEIPAHWPPAYRNLVQRRVDLIEGDRFIGLLERPEYKRRWASEPFEKRVQKALRSWLLDRLEQRRFWFDSQDRPVARTVAQLSDLVSRDAEIVAVLTLWSGQRDRSVTLQLTDLLADEGVPFLAAYRLKDSGLRKREAWEHTWALQRRKDVGEQIGSIPVPPKYGSADFRRQSWWQHRGKLDVPKERFVEYPAASRETDPTPLLGWAGWDHAQQALALNMVIAEREAEGWTDERLVPLVAGLAELQPWVRQWHDRLDDTYQVNLADYLSEELRSRATQVGHTLEQLAAWRPSPATRGRARKS